MTTETWLLFAISEIALCISPGPAVLYVSSMALARGFRESVPATLGIVTGNSIYFVASAFGVGALVAASGDLFTVVRWAGIGYLVWVALRMMFGRSSVLQDPSASAGRRRVWRGGVLVQLSNPKNLIFFVAILPPFIDTDGNVPFQVAILGLTSQVIETIVLMTYGLVTAGAGRRLRDSPRAGWIDGGAGLLLLGVALALALTGIGV